MCCWGLSIFPATLRQTNAVSWVKVNLENRALWWHGFIERMSENILRTYLSHLSAPRWRRTKWYTYKWKTYIKSIVEDEGLEDSHWDNILLLQVKLASPLREKSHEEDVKVQWCVTSCDVAERRTDRRFNKHVRWHVLALAASEPGNCTTVRLLVRCFLTV
jgi:hypothetical protein